MDPNATLQEIRELVSGILHDDEPTDERTDRLAELVQALDEWLSKRGFLPVQWGVRK
jgi:hypothetical protein